MRRVSDSIVVWWFIGLLYVAALRIADEIERWPGPSVPFSVEALDAALDRAGPGDAVVLKEDGTIGIEALKE